MGTTWANRLRGVGDESPEALLGNPLNARRHPGGQRDALRESLGRVGWVSRVLVNESTGFVVDGHARIEEAITRGEPTVPVQYIELTDEEERFVLATLDPITALADNDEEVYRQLTDELEVESASLEKMIVELRGEAGETSTPPSLPQGDKIRFELVFDNEDQKLRWAGFIYYVMETFDGETLAARLDEWYSTYDTR